MSSEVRKNLSSWTVESFSTYVNVPGTGTFEDQRFAWRRVGENMEIDLAIGVVTGSSDTNTITVTIPGSLNIDTNIKTGALNAGTMTFGSAGHFFDNSGPSRDTLVAQGTGATTTFRFTVTNNSNTPAILSWDEFDNGDEISAVFTIPIAEWRGQGTTETITLETQGFRLIIQVTV